MNPYQAIMIYGGLVTFVAHAAFLLVYLARYNTRRITGSFWLSAYFYTSSLSLAGYGLRLVLLYWDRPSAGMTLSASEKNWSIALVLMAAVAGLLFIGYYLTNLVLVTRKRNQ